MRRKLIKNYFMSVDDFSIDTRTTQNVRYVDVVYNKDTVMRACFKYENLSLICSNMPESMLETVKKILYRNRYVLEEGYVSA